MTPLPRTLRLSPLLAILLAAMCSTPQAPAQEPESATAKAYQNAKALYDNGKVAEALGALQTFEGEYRFSAMVPQVIYLQGWCWARMQKYHEAINTFDRLIKSYPTAPMVPDAILKQADCYRELKHYSKALDLYHEFEAKYPDDGMLSRALLGEAWTFLQQEDYTTAQGIAEKVRSRFANDRDVVLDAQFLTAQIRTAEKRYKDAFQIYEQIPSDAKGARVSEDFYLAGEAMFDAGRWTDAIACYKRVQPKASLIEQLRRQIDDLQSKQTNSAQRATLPMYEQELSDLRQLQVRCEAGPDLGALALFRIANCYQSLGQPDEASAAYREFLTRYPNDKLAEQAHLGLIQGLIGRRQFDDAEKAAREFQIRYPNSVLTNDAMLVEAEALFASGKISESLDRFQKLAASSPPLPILEAADFQIGNGYYTLHDFAHARDSFLSFVQRHPDSTMILDAMFRLGRCYFEISQQAGDPAAARANLVEAIKDYEQLRATYPSSAVIPEVIFQLGYLNACLAAQEVDPSAIESARVHHGKAVASFQEAVKRWPENPFAAEALYQLARNQYALGRFDEAVGSYRKLIEGYPSSTFAPLAEYEIANCYGAENKRAEMVAQLRSFVARYPTHPRVGSALCSIASQLEREQKTDEAIVVYRDVIARAMSTTQATAEARVAAVASETRVAAILATRGDVTNAVLGCERLLGRFHDDPASARAMVGQIAEAYRTARKFQDAYACLDQLAAEYSSSDSVRITALASTIDLALDEGDSARAYAAASKLLTDPARDRLPSASYVSIGNALLQHGQFAEARDAFQKALTLYPNDSETAPLAQLGLGEAALGLHHSAEAEEIFRQLTLAGSEGSIRDRAELGLARVYRARATADDPQDPYNVKAIELLNNIMVTAKGSDAGEAAYLLGNSYFSFRGDEQENKKTALAYYLRASLAINGPHGEEAVFRSAQCGKALGNPEIARRAFEGYLRRFPGGRFAADAKKELESLPAQPQPS